MLFTNRWFVPFLNMENFLFNSSVKDMQPYTVYRKGKDFIIEVKTLGIAPEDVKVSLNDNILEIAGETSSPYSEDSFNTLIRLSVSKVVLDNLESVKYKSTNGLTYVTLKMKEEKKPTIAIERE